MLFELKANGNFNSNDNIRLFYCFYRAYLTTWAPVKRTPGAIREAPPTYKLTSLPPT